MEENVGEEDESDLTRNILREAFGDSSSESDYDECSSPLALCQSFSPLSVCPTATSLPSKFYLYTL
jgi:hypothetical protein